MTGPQSSRPRSTFWGTAPETRLPVVSLPDAIFLYNREHTGTLSSLAAYTSGDMTLSGFGDPERVNATAVSGDFLRVMRVAPLLGRSFAPDELVSGASPVAMLRYGLWQRRFGGDSSAVGRAVLMGSAPTVVVGIMPRGFDFLEHAEAWGPLTLRPDGLDNWYLSTGGRLAPGHSVLDVRREMERLTDDFMVGRPDRFPTRGEAEPESWRWSSATAWSARSAPRSLFSSRPWAWCWCHRNSRRAVARPLSRYLAVRCGPGRSRHLCGGRCRPLRGDISLLLFARPSRHQGKPHHGVAARVT